jgi:hypothetical protein
MCDNELLKKEARRIREIKGFIKVERARDGDYDNECVLNVSNNGYQITNISLSENEAKEVIRQLNLFFNFK